MRKSIGVEGYKRVDKKTGKLVTVKKYRQLRDLADLLKAIGRPEVQANVGEHGVSTKGEYAKVASALPPRLQAPVARLLEAAGKPPAVPKPNIPAHEVKGGWRDDRLDAREANAAKPAFPNKGMRMPNPDAKPSQYKQPTDKERRHPDDVRNKPLPGEAAAKARMPKLGEDERKDPRSTDRDRFSDGSPRTQPVAKKRTPAQQASVDKAEAQVRQEAVGRAAVAKKAELMKAVADARAAQEEFYDRRIGLKDRLPGKKAEWLVEEAEFRQAIVKALDDLDDFNSEQSDRLSAEHKARRDKADADEAQGHADAREARGPKGRAEDDAHEKRGIQVEKEIKARRQAAWDKKQEARQEKRTKERYEDSERGLDYNKHHVRARSQREAHEDSADGGEMPEVIDYRKPEEARQERIKAGKAAGKSRAMALPAGVKPFKEGPDKRITEAKSRDELLVLQKTLLHEWGNAEGTSADRDALMDAINARWTELAPEGKVAPYKKKAKPELADSTEAPKKSFGEDRPSTPGKHVVGKTFTGPGTNAEANRERAKPSAARLEQYAKHKQDLIDNPPKPPTKLQITLKAKKEKLLAELRANEDRTPEEDAKLKKLEAAIPGDDQDLMALLEKSVSDIKAQKAQSAEKAVAKPAAPEQPAQPVDKPVVKAVPPMQESMDGPRAPLAKVMYGKLKPGEVIDRHGDGDTVTVEKVEKGLGGATGQMVIHVVDADGNKAAWESNFGDRVKVIDPVYEAHDVDAGTVGELRDGFDGHGGSGAKYLEEQPDGSFRFSAERQALHDSIIAGILAGQVSQDHPKYNVMGGGPAAGKSSMEKANPDISAGAAVLNADDIKTLLPEYQEMVADKDGAAAYYAHEESSYLVKRVQAEAFKASFNVTLDGTGDSSAKKMRKKIQAARDAGYSVHGFYVTIPTEVAVERAYKRGLKTGRQVPDAVIRNTHRSVSQVLDELRDEFDTVVLYDNELGTKQEENLRTVMVKKLGGKSEIVDQALWDQFVAKGTEGAAGTGPGGSAVGKILYHPSGVEVKIPAGGELRQHKVSKDSFLILDSEGVPVTFVNRNGRIQKPPVHAVKGKDTNYAKMEHLPKPPEGKHLTDTPKSAASSFDVPGLDKELADKLAKINLKGRSIPPALGTVEDPIDVGGDLDAAVQHLAAGRHVRLNQPDEVATLLNKLAFLVNGIKARGDKAPKINLCNVTVKGANIFCTDSKGIPRLEMPQLGGAPTPGSKGAAMLKPGETKIDVTELFLAAAKARGIKVEHKRVLASHLRASQAELDGPTVARMMAEMAAGTRAESAICVSRDGYIIDGHHRWAGRVAQDAGNGHLGELDMPVIVLDADIGTLLDFARNFAASMGIAPHGIGAPKSSGPIAKLEGKLSAPKKVAKPAKLGPNGTLFGAPELDKLDAKWGKDLEGLRAQHGAGDLLAEYEDMTDGSELSEAALERLDKALEAGERGEVVAAYRGVLAEVKYGGEGTTEAHQGSLEANSSEVDKMRAGIEKIIARISVKAEAKPEAAPDLSQHKGVTESADYVTPSQEALAKISDANLDKEIETLAGMNFRSPNQKVRLLTLRGQKAKRLSKATPAPTPAPEPVKAPAAPAAPAKVAAKAKLDATSKAHKGKSYDGPLFTPPFGPGDKVYRHPQGKVVVVHPDGSHESYGPNGKKKPTSATAEKLAAGYGGWSLDEETMHPGSTKPAGPKAPVQLAPTKPKAPAPAKLDLWDLQKMPPAELATHFDTLSPEAAKALRDELHASTGKMSKNWNLGPLAQKSLDRQFKILNALDKHQSDKERKRRLEHPTAADVMVDLNDYDPSDEAPKNISLQEAVEAFKAELAADPNGKVFTVKIHGTEEGLSRKQVLALLGKPEEDPLVSKAKDPFVNHPGSPGKR